ncbi:MAG: hypothetical protein IEMM0008_1319 [bacterium]|nr:MAG: hypothetical protein IEMM0008_1319 [bacterium]
MDRKTSFTMNRSTEIRDRVMKELPAYNGGKPVSINKTSALGGLFALPWCCIIPAGFSILGLAGIMVTRTVTQVLAPYLFILSVILLARAHYLLYVKRQGRPISHVITWASTVIAVTLWSVRWLI